MYIPVNPSFTIYIKVGFKGVYFLRTCFPDECEHLPKTQLILCIHAGHTLEFFLLDIQWFTDGVLSSHIANFPITLLLLNSH